LYFTIKNHFTSSLVTISSTSWMTAEIFDGLCCHHSANIWLEQLHNSDIKIIAFSPKQMFLVEHNPPWGPDNRLNSLRNVSLSIQTGEWNLGILGFAINSLKYSSPVKIEV
jgi:hypothetical protein